MSNLVFDVQSPAFKKNITEFKHPFSQQWFLFQPSNTCWVIWIEDHLKGYFTLDNGWSFR